MPTYVLPVSAGLVLFVVSLVLYRIGGGRSRVAPSIWTHGSLAARVALLAWWAALALLAIGLVLAVRA